MQCHVWSLIPPFCLSGATFVLSHCVYHYRLGGELWPFAFSIAAAFIQSADFLRHASSKLFLCYYNNDFPYVLNLQADFLHWIFYIFPVFCMPNWANFTVWMLGMKWTIRVWFPAGEEIFSVLYSVQMGSGAHPAFYTNDNQVLIFWEEATARDEGIHLSPYSAKVRNVWRYTLTPSICVHGMVHN
jgi:hypothetical protein